MVFIGDTLNSTTYLSRWKNGHAKTLELEVTIRGKVLNHCYIYRECFLLITQFYNYSWNYFSVEHFFEQHINRTTCSNALDCVGDELQFCNHDADVIGFCEKCSNVQYGCHREQFTCYRGQQSCNDICRCKMELFSSYNILYYIIMSIM